MTTATLTLTGYTKTVSFYNFTDTSYPGTYMAQANLEFSQIGTAYASGPARKQRKMWSVSSIISASQWVELTALYEAWDTARAEGDNLAVVNLVDNLLGGNVSAEVFFTEPPALTKISSGNNRDYIASFVVVEV